MRIFYPTLHIDPWQFCAYICMYNVHYAQNCHRVGNMYIIRTRCHRKSPTWDFVIAASVGISTSKPQIKSSSLWQCWNTHKLQVQRMTTFLRGIWDILCGFVSREKIAYNVKQKDKRPLVKGWNRNSHRITVVDSTSYLWQWEIYMVSLIFLVFAVVSYWSFHWSFHDIDLLGLSSCRPAVLYDIFIIFY